MPRHLRIAPPASLGALAALAALTSACVPGATDTTGPIDDPEASVLPLESLGGSGVAGRVIVTEYDGPAPFLSVIVTFVTVGREDVGARYPMHTHAGRACGGAGVPVADDLGAPAAEIRAGDLVPSAVLEQAGLPPAHLRPGYYFDVHAPAAPDAAPLGCAVFVD